MRMNFFWFFEAAASASLSPTSSSGPRWQVKFLFLQYSAMTKSELSREVATIISVIKLARETLSTHLPRIEESPSDNKALPGSRAES